MLEPQGGEEDELEGMRQRDMGTRKANLGG